VLCDLATNLKDRAKPIVHELIRCLVWETTTS